VKDALGNRHDGWVVQVHCVTCNKYHSLAPNFIMPYKHYMSEVIEAAIKESEEGGNGLSDCPADDSTMRRWVNQFAERGALAADWLSSVLYVVYGCLANILEQQNMGALKRLAHLVRQIPIPETGGIIGKANIILTRYDHGFL
jgi:hypothetical protein